jgi:glycosyltransferase involved in cell wall biosynthesis
MGSAKIKNIDPGVTVLIPCNSTEFLAECLDSIATQDYSDISVLVVLNGKAIHERNALIQQFSKYSRKLKFVTSEKEGIVNALNLGLELSNNEFIARIDADDLMPPKRISLQIAKFAEDSEIVCIGGQLAFFDTSSEQKHPGYPLTDKDFRHALYRFSPLPHPGVMYKRRAVQLAGMYREKFPYIEDWDLWIRLADQGKIFNLSELTVFYRVHSNQSTTLHEIVQQKSIRALSREMLNQTLKGPDQEIAHGFDYAEPYSIASLLQITFLIKSPFVKQGLFGQKAKRRALAGYLYVRLIGSTSKQVQLVFPRIIISLIDPILILRKFV